MHSNVLKCFSFFLMLILWQSDSIFAQDIIHRKDERMIAAKVIKVDSSFVHYNEITDLKSPPLKMPLSEVSHIRFDYTFKNKGSKSSEYNRAKNALSIASGGTGGIFSLNYDRVLVDNGDFFLSGKIGVGSWLTQTNINIHVTGNYNFGGKKSHLEFGIGAAAGLNGFDDFYRFYASVPIIGYRYQDKPEGFFFRSYACAFLLLMDSWGSSSAVPMIGIDLGYTF